MNENINITHAALITKARNYCLTLENAHEADHDSLIDEVIRQLPDLYAAFTALDTDMLPETLDSDAFLPGYVDEEYYESIRRTLESVLGSDDTYLETFETDMKYSDTPIAASISENLADIFQDLFNFVYAIKESEGEQTPLALRICKENFEAYWGQKLCNVMRQLHHLKYAL